MASISPSERWTFAEIHQESNFCADLFPDRRCPSTIKLQQQKKED